MKTIRRDVLESHILTALQSRMLRDEHIATFCDEFTRHLNTLNKEHNAQKNRISMELDTTGKGAAKPCASPERRNPCAYG